MPANGDRLQLLFVRVAVMRAEQKLAYFKLDSNIGLCSTDVAAVSGKKFFSGVFHRDY